MEIALEELHKMHSVWLLFLWLTDKESKKKKEVSIYSSFIKGIINNLPLRRMRAQRRLYQRMATGRPDEERIGWSTSVSRKSGCL